MAEPLKNLYTATLINDVAGEIKGHYAKFDKAAFVKEVFARGWKTKELKARMRHIAERLHAYLPSKFSQAVAILKKSSPKFTGFEYMFFADYVELYGMDELDCAIDALAHFTPQASSEFAVRPFIVRYPKPMMKQMMRWAKSNDHHVRRLASEGCRPRLPWAMALPVFKEDPDEVLKILEKLKHDESEYVTHVSHLFSFKILQLI